MEKDKIHELRRDYIHALDRVYLTQDYITGEVVESMSRIDKKELQDDIEFTIHILNRMKVKLSE